MACIDVPGLAASLPMSRPLRILVIANLPPFVMGGAENQVARLVETWSGLGHHVEVTGHALPDAQVLLGSVEVRIHRIATIAWLGRGGRAISYFLSMARLLGRVKRDFDIVYCRGLGDGAISICLLKALGRVSLPLLACPINARGAGDTSFIRSIPGWRWIVSAINDHCNAINIIAPAIAEDLAAIGITAPLLSHIPNGIPLAPQVHRNAISPVRRLVWTGRLTYQKGLDVFLKVLAKVAATGRAFHLDIIGDGPDLTRLQELCRTLHLENMVLFHGGMPRHVIRDHLGRADVFVLPSRYEGMSNSALEAMEAGLPIFLTSCGGIDTYIDESIGWVCAPEDSEGMFDCLCRLLDETNTELLSKGRNARVMVEQRFAMESIAQQNIDLMQEIVSG
jgi:glycosyltransferase involved in cell wall biosynthesis